MVYNKLVRDKIPEIIKRSGGRPKIHIADDKEYWVELKEKLREETNEFLATEDPEEFADILEVLDAMFAHLGLTEKYVKTLQAKKAKERGGFKKRIILEEA